MYNFVNCLQFNIRYEKVERPAPGALVKVSANYKPRELLMAAMFLFDKSKRNEDILQRISQTLLLQSLVAIVLCFLRRRLIEI
jgi:hypothetical protein